jgi:hypothetical protein
VKPDLVDFAMSLLVGMALLPVLLALIALVSMLRWLRSPGEALEKEGETRASAVILSPTG